MGIDVKSISDPIHHIQLWLDAAEKTEPNDANAMSLATTGKDMMPNVRILLLKEIAAEGLYFYTNQTSTKAQELEENAKAAICLHWKSSGRQVRVQGTITKASAAKSDAYFATRHPSSQAGAWASKQSQSLSSREEFKAEIESIKTKFKDSDSIPRPENWGGYVLSPLSIEFWEERDYRLHTRLVFTRNSEHSDWETDILYP